MNTFNHHTNQLSQEYIEKCEIGIEYHKQMGENAAHWNNLLSTSSIILSAGTALTMSILTVADANSQVLTIVGSSYAFILTVVNKVKDSFSFSALSFNHYYVSDGYSDCKRDFTKIINDAESEDRSNFDRAVLLYEETVKKGHIQSVKNCQVCCCLK